ncbi:MAG: THUMP domain-containing protein, partial [Desulfuromonadaceae bacterium]|nr:THUMP domain-containing protein [Desulfuromonadaceae bacterium]
MSKANYILRPGKRSDKLLDTPIEHVSDPTASLKTSSKNFSAERRNQILNCFAAVPRGAEELAGAELVALGISDAKPGKGGVAFRTDLAGLYRANLWLRTASRVLVQLTQFPCSTPDPEIAADGLPRIVQRRDGAFE